MWSLRIIPAPQTPRTLKYKSPPHLLAKSGRVRQITPLPPKFGQAPERFNITQLVSQVSREVTQSVVSHLTGLGPAETQEDLYIREALAASRKEPAATVTRPDNVPAILRAMRTGGSGDQTRTRAIPATCGQPVAAVRPQPEPELPPRGRPGCWNPDPLGLQADITAQQQQKDKGRERRTGSAKRRSGSRPRDDVKRGRQTPSSDESSEPAIDWGNNKIGPRTPKSPARTSRISTHLRGNSRPASRYTQTWPDNSEGKGQRAHQRKKSSGGEKEARRRHHPQLPGYIHLRPDRGNASRALHGRGPIPEILRGSRHDPYQRDHCSRRLGLSVQFGSGFPSSGHPGIPPTVMLWLKETQHMKFRLPLSG